MQGLAWEFLPVLVLAVLAGDRFADTVGVLSEASQLVVVVVTCGLITLYRGAGALW